MGLSKDTQTLLREDARLLMRLQRRIQPFLKSDSPDWSIKIIKRNGSKMLSWRVASLFLQRWIEWADLSSAWDEVYKTKNANDDKFYNQRASFSETSKLIANDIGLLKKINDHICAELAQERLLNRRLTSLDEILDQVLIWDALSIMTQWLSINSNKPEYNFNALNTSLRKLINETLDSAPEELGAKISEAIEFYKAFKLDFSYIKIPRTKSAVLERRAVKTHTPMIHITHNAEDYPASSIISNTLNPILQSIDEIIQESGYGRLYEDLLDGFSPNLHGGSDVNIIPGAGGAKCCPLLLAFSNGDGPTRPARIGQRPKGLWQTLDAITLHLLRCRKEGSPSAHKTSVVALITNNWDSSYFEDFFDKFAEYHSDGVRFVFLIAGSDRVNPQLSEIKVNFR